MQACIYKKIAGTSAVFLVADYSKSTPIERDGMSWTATELHLEELPEYRNKKPTMASVLALEGLEEYEPAENGDVRHVQSIDADFVYFDKMRGWIQIS